jgi:hypothetical protein
MQASEWNIVGVRPTFWRMAVKPPLRFLRDYVLFLGFLDGVKGLQLAWMSAFYSFIKQAKLWEEVHAMKQRDVEAAAMDAAERRVREAA